MSFLNSILQGSSDVFRDLFADSSMLPLVLLFLAVFIARLVGLHMAERAERAR